MQHQITANQSPIHEPGIDFKTENWVQDVRKLTDLCFDGDDDGVIEWFATYLLRCMNLVPEDRRLEFVDGVYQVYEKESLAEDMAL